MTRRGMLALLAMLAGALAGRPAAAAEAPVEIDVLLPLTGVSAFNGAAGAQAVALAERQVNAEGGIGGRPVRFVVHDDQSSPQVALQIVTQLLPKAPPVILGSSLTAMCNAMAPLMRQGPVMYCYSPGIQPEPGGYVFSATVPTYGLVETSCAISLEDGVITRSELVVTAKVPGITPEKFQECAADAKANCPVSKAYNMEILLTATLA